MVRVASSLSWRFSDLVIRVTFRITQRRVLYLPTMRGEEVKLNISRLAYVFPYSDGSGSELVVTLNKRVSESDRLDHVTIEVWGSSTDIPLERLEWLIHALSEIWSHLETPEGTESE